MENSEKYKVRLSHHVKILTVVLGIILLIAEGIMVWAFIESNNLRWIPILIIILLPLFLLYFMLQMPNSIELTESSVILHKLLGKIEIPYHTIKTIRCYQPENSEVKLFGSGGFFGYTGKFYNKSLGVYNSYVGDYEQSFLIVTQKNKKYLFSCRNSEKLVDKVNIFLENGN